MIVIIRLPDGYRLRVEIVRRYRCPIDGSEQMDVRLGRSLFKGVPVEWAEDEQQEQHGSLLLTYT